MSYFVFDIETVPDLSLPPWEPAVGAERKDEKSFPPLAYHRVASIAGAFFPGDGGRIVSNLGLLAPGEDEEAMLSAFASFYEDKKPTLVSWNGRGFDMPVIGLRCFRYGIPLPTYYGYRNGKDVRYRYSTEGHYDVMDYLSDYGAGRKSTQDHASRLAGLPGKIGGVSGGSVEEMVKSGRLSEVQSYNLQDVVQLSVLWLRTELLRGKLKKEAYQEAASAVLVRAWKDPRCRAVVDGADLARVLLCSEEEVRSRRVSLASQGES